MSYMSGFMMGASIGKCIHQLIMSRLGTYPMAAQEPYQAPVFSNAHTSRNRRRYRIFSLLGNSKLAQLLQSRLTQLTYVTGVSVNTITGSLLICHTDERSMDILEDFLRDTLFVPSKPRMPAKMNTKLQGWVTALNTYISQMTHSLVDLNSLLSMLFVLKGLKKVILRGQRPSGPQLLWWAYGLLRGSVAI